jgi:hypothetical protein
MIEKLNIELATGLLTLGVAAVIFWSLFYRYDAGNITVFTGYAETAQSAQIKRTGSSWFLVRDGKEIADLSLQSPGPGRYDFKVERSALPVLLVGTPIGLVGGIGIGSSMNTLVCQSCMMLSPGSRLPGLWKVE